MTIIISPFSHKAHAAKNYPWWPELVDLLKLHAYVIQIGREGEEDINAHGKLMSKPLKYLFDLVRNSDTWISVDNFFPHFVYNCCGAKRGTVLFSVSDPRIYGYKAFTNVLKSRDNLRPDPFGNWTGEYVVTDDMLAKGWHDKVWPNPHEIYAVMRGIDYNINYISR